MSPKKVGIVFKIYLLLYLHQTAGHIVGIQKVHVELMISLHHFALVLYHSAFFGILVAFLNFKFEVINHFKTNQLFKTPFFHHNINIIFESFERKTFGPHEHLTHFWLYQSSNDCRFLVNHIVQFSFQNCWKSVSFNVRYIISFPLKLSKALLWQIM